MALKFLNKKGWHTGSLRNIENVWKAEQKHDAEQKKLEELRKQIQEERERSEFRLLQEQAGLVPKQERLDFLYDSGLAVGKASSSDGFKSLESLPKSEPDVPASSTKQQPSVPGALFEEKPQSANDAWRKLHSDPLLLIRQREQEALARVTNNPIQMAMIHRSVEAKKHKEKTSDEKEHEKKQKKSKNHRHSSSRYTAVPVGEGKRSAINNERTNYNEDLIEASANVEYGSSRSIQRGNKRGLRSNEHSHGTISDARRGETEGHPGSRRKQKFSPEEYNSRGRMDNESSGRGREVSNPTSHCDSSGLGSRYVSHSKRRNNTKLSEEDRAARLQEMQLNAELHEEQRWKRLKKAEDDDAREDTQAQISGNRNFLDAVKRSVYGAEKGGCSTIEESVRRRTHYSQGKSQVGEGNAFRRK